MWKVRRGRVRGGRKEKRGARRNREEGRRSLRSVSVTVTDTDRDPYQSVSVKV